MSHYVLGFSLLRAKGERWELTVYTDKGIALSMNSLNRDDLWERGMQAVEDIEAWEESVNPSSCHTTVN